MTDEGVLDPWVAKWLEDNPPLFVMKDILEPARSKEIVFPVTRDLARVTDEEVAGVPVRIYEHDAPHTGLIVYLHGGAMCIGSVAIMDNVARELAYVCGAALVSVEYRLAPEHPYPAGLDDCEAVTRWALQHTDRFGVPSTKVVIAGESAGGTLSAGVTLRLRDNPTAPTTGLAGQILIYPGVGAGTMNLPSRRQFVSYVMPEGDMEWCWNAYTGGRDLDHDSFAVPLAADSLADLPPAFVVLGGCDFLRDEGRLYAHRLREDGVDAEDICYPGQIHGFMNRMFPAASDAYERIGTWVRALLERTEATAAD
jgi:acetyl esterase